MEKDMDGRLKKIEETIKELPEKAQKAIYWTIAHWNFVEELCKNPGMTNEEIEKWRDDARVKEDYIMLALLGVAQTYINSDETSGQENGSSEEWNDRLTP